MPCRNVARQSQKQIRPIGIEPTHPAPEAGALSTELRAQITLNMILEITNFVKDFLFPHRFKKYLFFSNKSLHFKNIYIIISVSVLLAMRYISIGYRYYMIFYRECFL